MPPAEIDAALAAVGLADRARDRATEFSRGMKQRLALATALLGNPRLLVLDEPTDGLDPIGTVEIRKLLKRLRDGGATVFLSSHLLHEVEATCDRVAVLDGGKLRAVGSVGELKGTGAWRSSSSASWRRAARDGLASERARGRALPTPPPAI